MARYSPRGGGRDRGGRGSRSGGRGGSSRYGGRGGSSRSGGRSSRGGRGGRDDDDYYDEEPAYYGKGAKQGTHEQAGILIFGGAIVVVIITVIFLAAGGGRATVEKAMRLEKGGYYEKDEIAHGASEALGRARYFDQANPYEDKEIVAAKYQEVVSKYPGTASAREAAEYYDKVMDRRR